MHIDILTLFPEVCRAPLNESMMKRAQENGMVDLRIHNLRDWTTDKHHVVDDAPFGGGQGMVMKPEPIFAAVEDLRDQTSKVILMSPAGRPSPGWRCGGSPRFTRRRSDSVRRLVCVRSTTFFSSSTRTTMCRRT